MPNDGPILRFDVHPDYSSGFVFSWDFAGGFEDPLPWVMRVQAAKSPDGPWTDISPELEGSAWKSPGGHRVNKSASMFFRLSVETPAGTRLSSVVSPYGDLGRYDFLLGAEVMRREVLHMANMAGVRCSVWKRVGYGPRCPACTDPVTGHSRNNHCRRCLGTGRAMPYSGPFETWCLFSEDSAHKSGEGNEGVGMTEDRRFEARMVNSVPVSKNDVVRDDTTGKMHYVNEVRIVAELRRVPLVQLLSVSEAAVTDPAYMIPEVCRGS